MRFVIINLFFFIQLDYLGYSSSTFERAFGDEFEFSTLFKFPQRGEYEAVRDQVLNLEHVGFLFVKLTHFFAKDWLDQERFRSCKRGGKRY